MRKSWGCERWLEAEMVGWWAFSGRDVTTSQITQRAVFGDFGRWESDGTGYRAIQRTWYTVTELWWKRVDFGGREVQGQLSCAAGWPKIVSEAVTPTPDLAHTLPYIRYARGSDDQPVT